ncbi:hypothetical protein FB451DRAFT_1189316 [Mycena latifolia]|nr:hypothetical protein FB451DRAFT_1189316 [Mycena latifolia]
MDTFKENAGYLCWKSIADGLLWLRGNKTDTSTPRLGKEVAPANGSEAPGFLGSARGAWHVGPWEAAEAPLSQGGGEAANLGRGVMRMHIGVHAHRTLNGCAAKARFRLRALTFHVLAIMIRGRSVSFAVIQAQRPLVPASRPLVPAVVGGTHADDKHVPAHRHLLVHLLAAVPILLAHPGVIRPLVKFSAARPALVRRAASHVSLALLAGGLTPDGDGGAELLVRDRPALRRRGLRPWRLVVRVRQRWTAGSRTSRYAAPRVSGVYAEAEARCPSRESLLAARTGGGGGGAQGKGAGACAGRVAGDPRGDGDDDGLKDVGWRSQLRLQLRARPRPGGAPCTRRQGRGRGRTAAGAGAGWRRGAEKIVVDGQPRGESENDVRVWARHSKRTGAVHVGRARRGGAAGGDRGGAGAQRAQGGGGAGSRDEENDAEERQAGRTARPTGRSSSPRPAPFCPLLSCLWSYPRARTPLAGVSGCAAGPLSEEDAVGGARGEGHV